MGEAVCPRCGGEMQQQPVGQVSVLRCASCTGVFLDRADLGKLIEDENDWHAHGSTDTAQLPRISADMTAPPPRARARSYVDSLFKG